MPGRQDRVIRAKRSQRTISSGERACALSSANALSAASMAMPAAKEPAATDRRSRNRTVKASALPQIALATAIRTVRLMDSFLSRDGDHFRALPVLPRQWLPTLGAEHPPVNLDELGPCPRPRASDRFFGESIFGQTTRSGGRHDWP